MSGIAGLSEFARIVIAAQKSGGIVVGAPTKARTTERVSRTTRSCKPSGRVIQLEPALEPVAKGDGFEARNSRARSLLGSSRPRTPGGRAGGAIHGGGDRTRQSEEGAGACAAQQRVARHRRHDGRGAGQLSERPLARAQVPTSRRHLLNRGRNCRWKYRRHRAVFVRSVRPRCSTASSSERRCKYSGRLGGKLLASELRSGPDARLRGGSLAAPRSLPRYLPPSSPG